MQYRYRLRANWVSGAEDFSNVFTLRRVRCPEHGSHPTVVCSGRSLPDLSFKLSGCCEKLISATTAAPR